MNYINNHNHYAYGEMFPSATSKTSTLSVEPPPIGPDSIFTYPYNVANALGIIQEVVSGENEDKMLYNYLLQNATSDDEKIIISGIRNDEINHYRMFRELYTVLTGETIPPRLRTTEIESIETYCEGLKIAIIREQEAIRKYRQILYALQTNVDINKLTEIITDKIIHSSLYNYLYSKNACKL
ncbi:MAG: Rubrerythrin [Clostridiales bacterium]|jgi:rubrerythrin|nr:Rubrerythrin [Clostridiales bacterium]